MDRRGRADLGQLEDPQQWRAPRHHEAELLPPPHGMDASAPCEPVPELADWEPGYALVVSRLLPYKNVDAVIEAVRSTGRRLVVVGHGPEEARLRATLGPAVQARAA